ncbi:MAG: cytochrome b5-like heme/steroid binding domain-containing protein [Candidatus Paceibacterota bacterium]|jgi:cytochrome b involved in lipid metabolism
MKKELVIGIIGVLAVIGATVFYGVQYTAQTEYNPNSASLSPTSSGSSAVLANKVKSGLASIRLTLQEIAKHNTVSDCWMIVSGKVYSVGSYASAHPGGAQAITAFCGKDGTVAFETKGGKGSHSQNASDILASYYIGNVNDSMSGAQAEALLQKASTAPASLNGGESENEYEDD